MDDGYYTEEDYDLRDPYVIGSLFVDTLGNLTIQYTQPDDTLEAAVWKEHVRTIMRLSDGRVETLSTLMSQPGITQRIVDSTKHTLGGTSLTTVPILQTYLDPITETPNGSFCFTVLMKNIVKLQRCQSLIPFPARVLFASE